MTPEQIREIVKITVDELTQRKLIDSNKISYPLMLQEVESRLRAFFNNKGDGNGISYALNCIIDDPYIDVIFLQYRDGKTLEWIAEYMDKHEVTIKRNKKRLISRIYELLEV